MNDCTPETIRFPNRYQARKAKDSLPHISATTIRVKVDNTEGSPCWLVTAEPWNVSGSESYLDTEGHFGPYTIGEGEA